MPLILGTNSIKDTGYNVANSVRLNAGDNPSGSVTQGTPTNVDKYTFSVWVKRADIGASNSKIFSVSSGSTYGEEKLEFNNDDLIWRHTQASDGETVWQRVTDRKFRDPSAWYNIIVAYDSSQGTAVDRCKMYINGVQETSFSGSSNPSSGLDSYTNTSGRALKFFALHENVNSQNAGAYFAELVYIDGQQLDQTSFGEFDSDSPNIWKPIDVSELTFGNNGFYLDFEDGSALGNDVSGNNNDVTLSNIASTDQSTDTCTNNFATINPLAIHPSSTFTFSEGNLQFATSSSTRGYWVSTIAVSSGKWYWEYKVTNNQARTDVGIAGAPAKANSDPESSGTHDNVTVYLTINGQVSINSGGSTNNFYNQATSGNNIIIGTALDLDSSPNTIAFSIDGEWVTGSGAKSTTFSSALKINSFTNVASTVNGVYHFIAGDDGGDQDIGGQANFGNPPYSISSGNSDGNGYGNFEYAVPSGYYALNTKNLAEYG
jgi:hypothetical protein